MSEFEISGAVVYRAVRLSLLLFAVQILLLLAPANGARAAIYVLLSVPIACVGIALLFDVADSAWYLRDELRRRKLAWHRAETTNTAARIAGLNLIVLSACGLLFGTGSL